MSKIELIELLQQDIEDIKVLINYEKYEFNDLLKNQARAIILNLQDHLEEFIVND